jgi:hypothetical protein
MDLKHLQKVLGNATAFNSGILSAAKLLKSSSLSPIYKAAFVGASGVGSLLIFNKTKRIMPTDNTPIIVDVDTEVQKINTNMQANPKLNADSNQFESNCPLESEYLMQISNLILILDNALIINLLIMIIILNIIGFLFNLIRRIRRTNILNSLERNKLPLVNLGTSKKILSLLTYLINL